MNVTVRNMRESRKIHEGELLSPTYLKFTEGRRGPIASWRGSVRVFLRKPIATCDFGLNKFISQIDTYKYNNYKYHK